MSAQSNTPAGSIPPRPPLPGVPGMPAPASADRHVGRGQLGLGATPEARHPSFPPRPPLPAPPRAAEPFPVGKPASRLRAAMRNPRALLTAYVVVLTLIALWPVPVDSGAGGLLRRITRVLPLFTYPRIEFAANILLFVPLGILLALILQQRYLILPIALVSTVAIESVQALLLERRTPSVMDIIANLTGAALGLLIVGVVEWRRGRGQATP